MYEPVLQIKELYVALSYKSCKMFKRSVIGFFCIFRKTAGGKLPIANVILNAFATGSFFRTVFIGTVACFKVLCPVAFH